MGWERECDLHSKDASLWLPVSYSASCTVLEGNPARTTKLSVCCKRIPVISSRMKDDIPTGVHVLYRSRCRGAYGSPTSVSWGGMDGVLGSGRTIKTLVIDCLRGRYRVDDDDPRMQPTTLHANGTSLLPLQLRRRSRVSGYQLQSRDDHRPVRSQSWSFRQHSSYAYAR